MFKRTNMQRLNLAFGVLLIGCWSVQILGEDEQIQARADGLSGNNVESVASSRVLIWFEMAPDSEPFTRTDLWYTEDGARTWRLWTEQSGMADSRKHAPAQRAGSSRAGLPAGGSSAEGSLDYVSRDEGSLTGKAFAPLSPIIFDAQSDGLYGFYVVLYNAAGGSAPPPESGMAPQKWVRVDRSAPIVQVLTFRADDHFDVNREIHIRWTAQDDNLPDRPIKLHYRCEQTKTFRLIADLLAADGSYRWTVPEDVSGRVDVKVSATDRAGNTGRYRAEWLTMGGSRIQGLDEDSGAHPGVASMNPQTLEPSNPLTLKPMNPLWRGDPPPAADVVDGGAAKQAKNKYDLGTWHRLRGEYDVAMLRYREALKFNPDLLEARNDLGGLLFLQKRYEEAERELQRVLAKAPRHLAALKSLALVQATRRNYQSARETLQKLLLLNPDDAEAWMHFGDVTMFTGDRPRAREAWRKAGSLGTASAAVKERAAKRLAIYKTIDG